MINPERFKFYAAAYLVLINDGKILLLRRFNTGYHDGDYSFVAGHLDGNETVKQCIIREAKEEAGIAILSEDLSVVHVMHRFNGEREYFDTFLRASKWSGDICNMEPDKCDNLEWFALNKLPDNILPEIKLVLSNIDNNTAFSEFGLTN